MKTEPAMDATNLTQLSSREQLSALMDGALPADETRFLLRRLQHDASLAQSWERWRLSAEVMRGLAPTQRLPEDFALRVAASLRGEGERAEAIAITATAGRQDARTPAWLRWGSGAAVAASLAVVALMNQPTRSDLGRSSAVAVSETAPSVVADALDRATGLGPDSPAPRVPAQAPSAADIGSQAAALASAIAVVARPARAGGRDAASQPEPTRSMAALKTPDVAQPADTGIGTATDALRLLPQANIITRPWPRSVLPHASDTGLTVGFGDVARDVPAQNPFQQRTAITNMPPALIIDPPSRQPSAAESSNADRVDSSQP